MASQVISDSRPEVTAMKRANRLNFIDRTGKVYGRLTVISRAESRIKPSGKPVSAWNCLCECGNIKVVCSDNLGSGRTRSCGCLLLEIVRGNRGENHQQWKHGLSRTREYQSWISAKQRVSSPTHPKYPSYGGRGISMCARWSEDFEAFLADMGPRPEGTTLDRMDNDGPYEPGNCRWATVQEQARNRRSTVLICIDGVQKTVGAWSEESGIPSNAIWKRINLRRWDPRDAVFTSLRRGQHGEITKAS